MAQYDGVIRIGTKINTNGIDQGISGINKSLGKIGKNTTQAISSLNALGNSVKKLGSVIATAFAAKQIIQFGKEATRLGSELQEVENIVSVAFPNMTKAMNEFAASASKNFGLSETMAKRYSSLFGTMAKQFGFAEKEAFEMGTTLTGLAGDVASFYDITQDEAYTKLKSVFSGETETLKDIGVVMTEAALNQYALANGIEKTVNKMTEQEKVALRYRFVLERLSQASGDFIRTSDSWANQTRVLKLQFDSLKATLGQGLINILTPVLKMINALIAKLNVLAQSFKAFTELITGNKASSGKGAGLAGVGTAIDAGQDTIPGLGDDYNTAASGAENLASATEDAAEATKEAEKAAKGYLSPLDEIHKIGKEDIEVPEIEKVKDTVGDAGGAGNVITPQVDYGSLAEGETVIDELSAKLANIFNVFKEAWENKGQAVIASAKAALESLVNAAKAVTTTFYDVFTGGVGLAWVESCLELLRSMFDVVKSIADAFTEAWNSGAGEENLIALFTMLTNINELITTIADSFSRVFSSGIGVEIWTNILGIVTGVYNIIGNLEAQLTEAWNTAGLGDSIWAGILGLVNTVLETIHHIVDSTAEWAGKLDFVPLLESIDRLFQALQPLAENIGAGLEWFWDNVLLPIAGWAIEDAVPKFIEMFAAAVDVLNAAIEALQPLGQWLWDNFLQPLGQWAGETIIAAMDTIIGLLEKLAQWISENPAKFQAITLTVLAFFAAFKTAEAIRNITSFIGIVGQLKGSLGALVSGGFTSGASIVSKLANAFTLAAGGAGSLNQIFTMMFGTVGTALAGIGSIVLGAITAVMNFFSMLKEGFSWLNEILMVIGVALAAVGAVILGAPALVAAVVAGIVAAVATLVVVIKDNWDAICDFFSGAADWFDKNVVRPTINFFKGLWKDVSGFFKSLWDDIKGVWNSVSSWFNQNIIEPIASLFQGFYERVKQIFEGLWIIVQAVWIVVSKWFDDNVIQPIVGFFKGLYDKVAGFFSKLWDGIKEIWSKVSSWFNKTVTEPVTNFFKGVWTNVSKFFSSLWSDVKRVWEGVSGWFSRTVIEPVKNAWKSATDAIAGFFSSLWRGIANGVAGAMNGVIGAIESAINFIINAVNSFLSGFNSVVASAASIVGIGWGGVSLIPNVNLSRIPVPYLAQGTVVPPNKEFMAVLGDNTREHEVVSPLSTIKEANKEALLEVLSALGLTGGGGGGNGETIVVKLVVDGRTLADVVVNEGKVRQMSTGQNMFALGGI